MTFTGRSFRRKPEFERMIDLSLIIINWNTRQLLLDCLRSVYATVHRASFEIFVVDNGSTDGSAEAVIKEFPGVTVIANRRNEGFAKANNAAISRMRGTYAVLLNSDTVLKDGALDGMFDFMDSRPEVGMCGPQLLNEDGSLQTSTGVFPDMVRELAGSIAARLFPQRERPQPVSMSGGAIAVDFIIGACMFVRKAAIDAVGMLDPDYFFFYEEIDWCYRMQKTGWPVYHLPSTEVVHFGGRSTKNLNLRARVESWRSRYLYFRKAERLRGANVIGMVLLGLLQTGFRFLGYTLLNLLTLFLVGRLRRRWLIFGYLLVWHLRGMPVSMGLPRGDH
jgi:GT2 family glycosyltransferase